LSSLALEECVSSSEIASPVLELAGVKVWLEDGTVLLDGIDWTVRAGDQWALLGPNGAGKSTLLSIIRAFRFPSEGTVKVLGRHFGGSDLWPLREQIGHVDSQQKVLEWLEAEDVVLTGLTGSIQPIWNRYGPAETERARELLGVVGATNLIGRVFDTCSQGEKQRIRIARALMADPALLLLDEPTTGLDLPAREALLSAISSLTSSHPGLATIIVSHHLEELPATTTDAMLLRHGKIVASGESESTLTTEHVTACFGFPVKVKREDGRWFARATGSWSASAE
jgi:iron complex transport system ATP-binding protein